LPINDGEMDFLWVSVSFDMMVEVLYTEYRWPNVHANAQVCTKLGKQVICRRVLTELCTHLGICVHVWPTVLSVENLDHHVCGLVGVRYVQFQYVKFVGLYLGSADRLHHSCRGPRVHRV
jgi:hypothetical protein